MTSQLIKLKGYTFMIVPPMRKNKKYSVLIFNTEKDRWDYLLSFGSSLYEQFKDSTKLKLWAHVNHGDNERKRKYYERHGKTNDIFTAKYWSNRFLW